MAEFWATTASSKIGAGGMGEVYRARDERLERDVAVKVLPAGTIGDDASRKRFRKEALALSKLNHPNIETVHEFDTQDGVDFLVIEYIPGVTLNDRLARGSLPEKELLRLGTQLAEGLAAAHEQGVVHRDLKPGNLRVTPDGRLKILDFGLATLRPADASMATATTRSVTETQFAAGTLPYMAPEQLRGERVDHRCDIWAAGVVVYEMATGRRPFEAKVAMALAADIQTRPPTPPGQLRRQISPGLESIILKCLEKDPDLRYQTARDLLADFRRLSAAAGPVAMASPRPAARRATEPDSRQHRIGVAAWILVVILLAAIGSIATLVLRERLQSPAPPARESAILSLAVLPLASLSGDPDHEYLVDGLHEALIAELSKIGALRVISRTSTVRYRDGDRLLGQIAGELGVDAVVEGAVLRSGSRLRVSAQLIQVDPERHLWSDTFDRELTDVLYLTSDVAQAIASRIRVTLTPEEEAQLALARPVNPDAYELYAVGRHHWNQRTLDGHRQAIEHFRKALELDAGYAPVHAALADSYMLLGEQGGLPQHEARTLAEAAIRSALQLDANLADAQTSLGMWKFYYEWNWPEAEQAFTRAIQLQPGHAAARQMYGRSLWFVGRIDDALRELQQARELDPLSITVRTYFGQVYLFAREYDRAAEHLEGALALNPNHVLVRHTLGELYLARGRFADAVAQLERSVELSGEPTAHYLAMLGCAYARADRRADAIKILDDLTARAKQGLVSAFDLASLHAALGDTERALAWLEQGYEQRDYWLVQLRAWPWFDSLLSDPRYQALLERINLAPP